MGDEAGQRGQAGDFCSRQHVGALGAVEEGEVALVRHGGEGGGSECSLDRRLGGEDGGLGAAATQRPGGGSLAGGVAVLEGDLSKHQQACGRVGERRRAEEGGLGIMKEAPVEAPDGCTAATGGLQISCAQQRLGRTGIGV
jgi:hypothetical protein